MISIKDLLEKESIEILEEFKDFEIKTLNTLKEAKEDELSFVESKKYLQDLKNTKAKGVFIALDLKDLLPSNTIGIFVKNPYLALSKISKYFTQPLISFEKEPTVSENATVMNNVFIGKNSVIEEGVTLMPGVYVGNNVSIGKNSTLFPNCVIYDNTIIKEDVIIHGGAVIGSDGFGYVQDQDFTHHKIHHIGNVVIEEDVEIGSNSTIDRAVFGTTTIGKGVKIDNLVQIAHNCQIGEKCAIAGQTGLAGSTVLGDKVLLGSQSGVAGHLKIGNNAIIAARSGVTKTIEGGKIYAGFPLYEHKKWLKIQGKISRLVEKK